MEITVGKEQLGSIVGIIALTVYIVQLVKTRLVPAIPILGRIWGWVWVVGVAGGLVTIARWYAWLPGELPVLLVALAVGLMSSGAFEMVRSATKPIEASTSSLRAVVRRP